MRFGAISVAVVGSVLLSVGVLADAVITTRLVFKENVRQQVRVYSSDYVLDSVLVDFVNRSLVWTSVEWGGVESRIRVVTVADQAFYQIPDTVVEIIQQVQVNANLSKSLKAILPQFLEELGVPVELPSATAEEHEVPIAFTYWDDTLQLIPVPVQDDDTLYFYGYVEHPSLSADTMVIRLEPAFSEAAVFYCASLVLASLGEYEASAFYRGLYEKTGASARARANRKFDILPPGIK